MKVWQKDNTPLNKQIEEFTIGKDIILDQNLVEVDCFASIAHAKMLKKIGVLNEPEFQKLKKALLEIIELNEKGKFNLESGDEDVHSKIENHLTKKLGNLGKKIHTARSRNDQVLVDLRLYSKQEMLEIMDLLLGLCEALYKFSKKNEFVPMPGYTHGQKAMPSSAGLWSSAFVESLLDDLELLKNAYHLNNHNPLGSAAGYGVSLNIDRELTTKLLGFEKVQNNVLYVQNSRGKVEAIILNALCQITLDLNKVASDLILFSTKEFDFVQMPREFYTGSSIMPQKCNPDVLELIRAKSSEIQSYLFRVMSTISSLNSGYSRDFQLTKEPLIEGLGSASKTLAIAALVINNLKLNKAALSKAMDTELFATDKALELVSEGVPFRDAYKKVAESKFDFRINPVENIKAKKHIGATGNLDLNGLKKRIDSECELLKIESKKFRETIGKIKEL